MPEFVPISKTRERYTFGRAHDVIEMPDMIEVQRDSYQWFYQDNEDPDLRASQGLQELLREVFPIKSYDGNYALEFVRYTIDKAKITEEEARQKDMTWARPIKATIRLTNMTTMVSKEDKETLLMLTESGGTYDTIDQILPRITDAGAKEALGNLKEILDIMERYGFTSMFQ